MKAHIEPRGHDARIVEIGMEDGDRLGDLVAHIALPYLRRQAALEERDGMPVIEDADLPAWLRSGARDDQPPINDGRSAERWAYVLGEMIWAMEAVLLGNGILTRHVVEPGHYDFRPNKEHPGSHDIVVRRPGVVDMEGAKTDAERRREGLRLFARYMEHI